MCKSDQKPSTQQDETTDDQVQTYSYIQLHVRKHQVFLRINNYLENLEINLWKFDKISLL